MQEVFKFKNFSISQDHCAMKVGTDGVLIGAWANGGEHILDIGSGTGLISMMMAQRFPGASIEGVEIDNNAVEQSKENISASSFKARIKIHHCALQDFKPSNLFDAIVSNPPYFVNSLTSPDPTRSIARHTQTMNFSDIVKFAVKWLDDDGELSIILPIDVSENFMSEAFYRGLFLSRQYDIKTVARKAAKRCMLAFSKKRQQTFERQTVTLISTGGKRSEWYDDITKEFYIK